MCVWGRILRYSLKYFLYLVQFVIISWVCVLWYQSDPLGCTVVQGLKVMVYCSIHVFFLYTANCPNCLSRLSQSRASWCFIHNSSLLKLAGNVLTTHTGHNISIPCTIEAYVVDFNRMTCFLLYHSWWGCELMWEINCTVLVYEYTQLPVYSYTELKLPDVSITLSTPFRVKSLVPNQRHL